jgi:hypothetical protein
MSNPFAGVNSPAILFLDAWSASSAVFSLGAGASSCARAPMGNAISIPKRISIIENARMSETRFRFIMCAFPSPNVSAP